VARRVTTPTSRGQGLHQRKGGRAANDAHRDAPRAASSGEEGGGGAPVDHNDDLARRCRRRRGGTR
jgi:hypothetical protein